MRYKLTGQYTSRRILVDNLNSAAGAVAGRSRIQDDPPLQVLLLAIFCRCDSPGGRERKPRIKLRAHRHEGFWACMDTYKDAVALNDLWATGEAPWIPG